MKAETAKKKPSLPRQLRDRGKKLKALVAKQGVAKTATFEHLLGAGVDLWDGDRDFKNFLHTVKAVREEKG